MWNLVSKCNFLHFWPPEKSVFKLILNLKFSFSKSGPGIVFTFPQNQYFYLSFRTFNGIYLENASSHILSSNSAGNGHKIWTTWTNFLFSMWLSNGEYFKDF